MYSKEIRISLNPRGHGNKLYAMATKKRNLLQSPLNVPASTHVKFLCFATFFLKFFVAETNKKSNWFDLFLFQQQKSYVAREKTRENPRVPAPWVDFLKHFFTATSKTWTRTLDPDPEKPRQWKNWTLKNLDSKALDSEKPGLWKPGP